MQWYNCVKWAIKFDTGHNNYNLTFYLKLYFTDFNVWIRIKSPVLLFFQKSFTSVVSIDVGLSNIAMTQLTPTLEVHAWDFIPFTPPKPYSPKNLYTEVD